MLSNALYHLIVKTIFERVWMTRISLRSRLAVVSEDEERR